MTPTSLLLLLLLLALLVAIAAWWWERGRGGRRSRARMAVALQGEAEAERLLASLGYEVVERQVWADWEMEVDGEVETVSCRADLLVRRAGELFVAEVKTGQRAPDPTRPATRRQLLEYALVFEVDGVLLVDMAAREVRAVRMCIGGFG